MNEIPDALQPLIETHEEDGDPVAVCDPGCDATVIVGQRTYWRGHYDEQLPRIRKPELGEDPDCAYCRNCGTLFGFLSDGTPYRIRHSRVVEALEQAQAALTKIASGSPPDDWEWYTGEGYEGYGQRGDTDFVDDPGYGNYDDMHKHGWACGKWVAAVTARAALAATKEEGT